MRITLIALVLSMWVSLFGFNSYALEQSWQEKYYRMRVMAENQDLNSHSHFWNITVPLVNYKWHGFDVVQKECLICNVKGFIAYSPAVFVKDLTNDLIEQETYGRVVWAN